MQVSVIGAGYVGLVTGACLASKGHVVTCVDLVHERIDTINRGYAPFHESGLDALIAEGLNTGKFKATSNLELAMQESQVSIIAVPTPVSEQGIDLTAVSAATLSMGQILRRKQGYHAVVVKSTVVPGTTDGMVRSILEESSGLSAGEFGLCMNPEFLREGSAVTDFLNPDRIVIGEWDNLSGELLINLYAWSDCPKVRTSLRNAEFIKYASNALLATLISFSNEIASLCEATPGADVDEVMEGLHLDHRLSPIVDGVRVRPEILTYLRAGAGFGGSCLPKDVKSLRLFAKHKQVDSQLLDAVFEVNERRFQQLVCLAEQVLGNLKGRIVTVLGLAFKPGTDDLRDSPAMRLIDHLLAKGAHVRVYDPLVCHKVDVLLAGQVKLCRDAEESVSGAEAVVIATAHPEFAGWDWQQLCATMDKPVVIDGRNALKGVSLPPSIDYRTIGRHYAVSNKSKCVPR
ncbi:MAG: UDP-glucose/GDP-mannose dehydrogenase family protein [Candidatus Melainabacteria bacterium]|nr:UDP-glucose/GDP-mannose dehydrogenase family protein [Candidatus Melainabacteria bacterium]